MQFEALLSRVSDKLCEDEALFVSRLTLIHCIQSVSAPDWDVGQDVPYHYNEVHQGEMMNKGTSELCVLFYNNINNITLPLNQGKSHNTLLETTCNQFPQDNVKATASIVVTRRFRGVGLWIHQTETAAERGSIGRHQEAGFPQNGLDSLTSKLYIAIGSWSGIKAGRPGGIPARFRQFPIKSTGRGICP